eukprot:jgi/Hompol1/2261/HPOL_005913-RA
MDPMGHGNIMPPTPPSVATSLATQEPKLESISPARPPSTQPLTTNTAAAAAPSTAKTLTQPTLPATQTAQQQNPKPSPTPTFYKRVLPTSCISFNSAAGRTLFQKSLAGRYIETFFTLSMQFLTQSEPAYCGLSSLCMILNALEIDPMRQWKGIWRWYDETMLDCCKPLEEIREDGISVGEFVCLARCNGLNAESIHPDSINASREKFVEDIKSACATSDQFIVVSFHRPSLDQTGSGHFSPIGGYNDEERQVLILDVARFKYPPYWVSIDRLWDAMHPIDPSTQKPRGYIKLSRGKRPFIQSVFSQLAVNFDSWPRLATILFQDLPRQFRNLTAEKHSVQDVISIVIAAIPDDFDSVVDNRISLFLPQAVIMEYAKAADAADVANISNLPSVTASPQALVSTDISDKQTEKPSLDVNDVAVAASDCAINPDLSLITSPTESSTAKDTDAVTVDISSSQTISSNADCMHSTIATEPVAQQPWPRLSLTRPAPKPHRIDTTPSPSLASLASHPAIPANTAEPFAHYITGLDNLLVQIGSTQLYAI